MALVVSSLIAHAQRHGSAMVWCLLSVSVAMATAAETVPGRFQFEYALSAYEGRANLPVHADVNGWRPRRSRAVASMDLGSFWTRHSYRVESDSSNPFRSVLGDSPDESNSRYALRSIAIGNKPFRDNLIDGHHFAYSDILKHTGIRYVVEERSATARWMPASYLSIEPYAYYEDGRQLAIGDPMGSLVQTHKVMAWVGDTELLPRRAAAPDQIRVLGGGGVGIAWGRQRYWQKDQERVSNWYWRSVYEEQERSSFGIGYDVLTGIGCCFPELPWLEFLASVRIGHWVGSGHLMQLQTGYGLGVSVHPADWLLCQVLWEGYLHILTIDDSAPVDNSVLSLNVIISF